MKRTLAILLFAALAATAIAQQSAIPTKLVKVRDDLYLIENVNATVADIGSYGGNIGVFLTNDGVLLVDSKNERTHDDVVAKVRSLTDKPIKYLVLTHNHGDHSGGAAKMQALGASIIISADDRENMGMGPSAGNIPGMMQELR
jgi:cyclase